MNADRSVTMSDSRERRSCIGPVAEDIRTKFLNREVIGIACLSGASIFATLLLLLACVTRGECEHVGPDTCGSRKHPPGIPGFRGNNDFYGLGIRLGIYFQWFASLIANALLDEDVRRTTTAPYIGFQIAVLAALLLLVFRDDCTFTAEVMVSLHILLGGVFVVLAPELVQSFRHVQWKDNQRPRYQLFSTFVWILVGWVVPVSTWFWVRLADVDGPKTDFHHTPGGTSMFLVGHVTDRGIKVASVFMAIWSLLLGLFALEKISLAFLYQALGVELRPVFFMLMDIFCQVVMVSFLLLRSAFDHVVTSVNENSSKSICECIIESLQLRRDVSLGDITRSSSALSHDGKPEVLIRVHALILALISIIMTILSVELTLTWNHVSEINSLASTGQIVPLFVGLVTLAAVYWELLKKVKGNWAEKLTPSDLSSEKTVYSDEACLWAGG